MGPVHQEPRPAGSNVSPNGENQKPGVNTEATKIILGCYALILAFACLWVPWFAPRHSFKLLPPGDIFLGYGWFWKGTRSKIPFDPVSAARTHWGAHEFEDIETLRKVLASPEALDKEGSDKEILDAARYFLNVLAPSGAASRPAEIPNDVMKLSKDKGLERGLLSIADRNQVVSWLKLKDDFDRTFPEKKSLSQAKELKLLDEWDDEWGLQNDRDSWREFAQIKYSYIGLEALCLTAFAGAIVAFRSR